MIHSLSAAIVAALPDAIVSIDRTSTVIHVNEAAEALFGFPAAEFIGRTLAETIIPPELSAQHDRGIARERMNAIDSSFSSMQPPTRGGTALSVAKRVTPSE